MTVSDMKALFLRIRASEMRQLDMQAVQAMRSRANYVSTKIAAVVAGTHPEPVTFPEPAPAEESLVLFVRVPAEFKQEVEHRAKAAEVPISRWIRGVLFPIA